MSIRLRALGIGTLLVVVGALIVGLRHQRTSGAGPTVTPATGVEGGI
jgi:hypothetical protein